MKNDGEKTQSVVPCAVLSLKTMNGDGETGTTATIAGRRWRCRMDRNEKCQYITEDEVWERFVIVRRMWMKYNGREPQEVQDESTGSV